MAAHQAPPSLGFSRQNTGVGCHFLLQFMKVKSESEVAQSCPTLSNPMDYIAYQAPQSMGFSRQEYWSGVPSPSPMEYYSTIKKNKIMPFAATWIDLEIIILRKPEKDKYHMISLMYGI